MMHEPFGLNDTIMADYIFYGHTHRIDTNLQGDRLVLNPGRAVDTSREDPPWSCSILPIDRTRWWRSEPVNNNISLTVPSVWISIIGQQITV